MSISTIGLIVWFAVYGINTFWSFSGAGTILGVVAIVIAIALLVSK